MRSLDHNILLDGSAAQVAGHLIQSLVNHDAATIHKEIAEAVQIEAIPPTVVPTWLSVAKSPNFVRDFVYQDYSRFARKCAIRELAKDLRTDSWNITWRVFGETQGFLSLLAALSVKDVQHLTTAVGDSYKNRDKDKSRAVTELFQCLWPSHFPEAPFKNRDGRPIQLYYLSLLPACDEDCVTRILSPGTIVQDTHLLQRLLVSHPALMQRLCLQSDLVKNLNVRDASFLWRGLPGAVLCQSGYPLSVELRIAILKEAATSSDHPIVTKFDITQLIDSLMKRSLRGKSPELKEVLSLGLKYYKQNPESVTRLSYGRGGFLFDVVCIWGASSRLPKVTVEQSYSQYVLTEILQLVRPPLQRSGCYDSILHLTDETERYRLLHLCVLLHNGIDIDIDAQLSKWNCTQLSILALSSLERNDAKRLLRRLMEAKPACDFLSAQGLIFEYLSPTPQTHHLDCDLLLANLHDGDDTCVRICEEKIKARKALAIRSREQSDRAFYAKTVVLYAISSQNLEIFHDVVLWARRFTRDPLTVKTLYDGQLFVNRKLALLLSGCRDLDKKSSSAVTPTILKEKVASCNSVMRSMFETILEAHREPAFYGGDWISVMKVMSNAIDERQARIASMEVKSRFSDDELFQAFWPDTINLLIYFEQQSLQDGYEALRSCFPDGPLVSISKSSMIKRFVSIFPPNVLKFYDELAQARNNLWKQYREMENPASTEIPNPFTRGLPIQLLTRDGHIVHDLTPEIAPFLAARAKDIVFMPVKETASVMTLDEAIRAAIGVFVDSLSVALEVYVLQDKDEEKMRSRMHNAWCHWKAMLCKCKDMSEDDTESYLRETLNLRATVLDLLPERAPLHHGSPDCPARPLPTQEGDIIEWNPASGMPSTPTKREFDPTLVDSFVLARQYIPTSLMDEFMAMSSWTAQTYEPSRRAMQWVTSSYRPEPIVLSVARPLGKGLYLKGSVVEGLCLAAILTIDAKRKVGERQLATPYPSSMDVRYPAAYLESSFLEDKYTTEERALEVLRDQIKIVPSGLLASLTGSSMDSLSAVDRSPNLFVAERTALRLLKLLTQSDKPLKASGMIIEVLFSRPEASSWHRQLLTPSFGRRISVAAVEEFFTTLIDGLIAKIQEQTSRSSTTEKVQQSYVKITTIKLLAQILREADYISTKLANDMLKRIFQHSKHIDVRVAVVEAWLDRLAQSFRKHETDVEKSTPRSDHRAVIEALQLIIPVISSFDERQQLTEEQWQSITERRELPETFADDEQETSPILDKLLSSRLATSVEGLVFDSILMPAINASISANAQVLHFIAKKNNLDPDFLKHVIPFRMENLGRLFKKFPNRVPGEVLDSYTYFVKEIIRPSESVAKVIAHYKSHDSPITSTESEVWATFFDQRRTASDHFAIYRWMLTETQTSRDQNGPGINVDQLQNHLFELGKVLIDSSDDPNFVLWKNFTIHLYPSLTTPASFEVWRDRVQPVVERILSYVESLRTKEWHDDPARQPVVLPPTLELKAFLLPYPVGVAGNYHLNDGEISTFAAALMELFVTSVDLDQQTALEPLRLLVTAAKNVRGKFYLHLMCHLGTIAESLVRRGGRSVPHGLMMTHTVHEQLQERLGSYHDPDTSQKVGDMIDAWNTSSNEEVRLYALKLTREVARTKGK